MFKRTNEQISFFKKISKKSIFELDFDFWYLCLLVGIAAGRKEQLDSSNDMTARFPNDYSSIENLLISMLIHIELVEKGIEPDDKQSVRQVVEQIIDPTNRPFLTTSGFKVFNEYSNGGFEIINEAFRAQPPDDPSSFLIKYGVLVEKIFGQSKMW